MMSSVTGPETRSRNLSRPLSLLMLSPATGLGLNTTRSGGHTSISRPIRARALLIPAKCISPVSGPDCQRRGWLLTFAAAATQACRCSSVNSSLQALAMAPNAARVRRRAGVRTFQG